MGSSLKEEVLKIIPVQKQTRAGQRKRFKAIVAIADCNCYVGLGVKCSKEVATKTQVILPEVKVQNCIYLCIKFVQPRFFLSLTN